MLPVGYLMIEHRLIDRMVALIKEEAAKIRQDKTCDSAFVGQAIDFIKTYADRGHHGKEEDILFKGLSLKELSLEHKKVMQELIDDHAFGRRTVKGLEEAHRRHADGDPGALAAIAGFLNDLAVMYPAHVEKEDKHFFLPVMKYLNQGEQDTMLEAFREFDRKLTHEKYKAMVEGLESGDDEK